MHWILSQKAACEFSRHNLQQSGPSSYVYLLFTFLLFLLLFLLVLFSTSLLLFLFPFLRLLFLLLFTKTFAAETLFSGKTDTLAEQPELQFDRRASAMHGICFEVTKTDFRILWFFSFPPKEKKKKRSTWVPKEPFHMINLFSLDYFNFTKQTCIFPSDFFSLIWKKIPTSVDRFFTWFKMMTCFGKLSLLLFLQGILHFHEDTLS